MGDRVAVMSDGVLEQVGDTREVYEHPANVFVAGFIGSPAMSFATVRAIRNSDTLTLSRGELSLALDAAHLPAGHVPDEVIVGVRPEHTRLWSEGEGLLGPIGGRAEFVEMLGCETLIGVVTAGDLRFTVHAEADASVKPGEQVRFGLEPGRLYLFDVSSQQALGLV